MAGLVCLEIGMWFQHKKTSAVKTCMQSGQSKFQVERNRKKNFMNNKKKVKVFIK